MIKVESKKKHIIIILIFLISTIGIGLYINRDYFQSRFFAPRSSSVEKGISVQELQSNEVDTQDVPNIEIVAENLSIPWDIAFLPDGGMLVTERPGTLLKIDTDTHIVQQIEGVHHEGEGGLLGIALDPDFADNNYIYLYLTSTTQSGIENRVERYSFTNERLSNQTVIIEGIKGARYHDGGRIDFGPDGKLYITTGDAQDTSLAQNTSSLNGKILRINADGSIPTDNPFGNAVYSYGHRNPQGLAWDSEGQLFSSEHGPSGAQTGNDEINRIVKGENYGWPTIKGTQTAEGMQVPLYESGSSDTWAPGGLVYYHGSLFVPGLRGESLYEARIDQGNISSFIAHFSSEYGRLRTIRIGPDGFFYITTSNQDGRGKPQENDDRIIKVNPEIFN